MTKIYETLQPGVDWSGMYSAALHSASIAFQISNHLINQDKICCGKNRQKSM